MGVWEAVVLGIVQGLTEFLPVSSSGHLVLVSYVLGVQEATITFEILVHFGSLVAIFVVFWEDILQLCRAGVAVLRAPTKIRQLLVSDPGVRLLAAIALGTVPAVLVTLLFKDAVVSLFNAPYFAGAMLMVTGTILYLTDRTGRRGTTNMERISWVDGLVIGCGQALAIIPGISRSGTTIGTGLLRGLERETAARFSFLLVIPAILGAMVLAIDDLFVAGETTTSAPVLAVGTIVSAITSYFAIKFLLSFVRRGRLVVFSYYTWTVGLVIFLLSFR